MKKYLLNCVLKKPEAAELYNLFVTETNDELIGTFNLRDLVVAEPKYNCKSDYEIRTCFLV